MCTVVIKEKAPPRILWGVSLSRNPAAHQAATGFLAHIGKRQDKKRMDNGEIIVAERCDTFRYYFCEGASV